MTGRPSSNEDGSLLIEVLVAFVILATAIVMAFQIFGDGLRRMSVVEPKMLAIAVARKELAQISGETKTAPTQLDGTDESGLPWHMTVEPINGGDADWTSMRPFRVRMWTGADTRDSGGQPVLETVILASVPKS
jgi:type II secretory pathway pseudopilin PulG